MRLGQGGRVLALRKPVMSDYFEGLKLMQKIGVPCKDCATASIWCAPCAARWRKACEEQKQAEQRKTPNAKVTGLGRNRSNDER
jgi:hypothetical protein